MSDDQTQSFIEQATQSLQSGQLNQALDFANQAILLNPQAADAYVIKAVALAQMHQSAEATGAFEDALRIQPDNAKTRFNFAVHLVHQNQKPEAIAQASEALRLDPSHAGARQLLGQLEADMGIGGQPRPPEGAVPPPVQGAPGPEQPYGANPYQQNPYGSPYGGPNQPYVRPQQSGHNVALVEQIGTKTWTGIGWGFVAAWFILFIIGIVTAGPEIARAFNEGMTGNARPGPAMGNPIQTVLSWILSLGALTWMIVDIVDRRSNWVWLVFYVLCCCCAPVQVLYMALGRKQ